MDNNVQIVEIVDEPGLASGGGNVALPKVGLWLVGLASGVRRRLGLLGPEGFSGLTWSGSAWS
jgi:hypothetical protein